jgi:hypothetical protein
MASATALDSRKHKFKQTVYQCGARTVAGLSGPIMALPGHHHHSILDALYERDGALTQALARLALG